MTTSLDSTAPSEEDVYRFPASFGQQRLWVLDQLEPGSPVYNIAKSIRLTGPLNVAVLEQSLHEIVRRHESLRTTLTTVEGQPMQVIAPTLTLPLPCVNLQDLPEGVRVERAAQRAAQEARQPFDLAHGPLLRTSLLRLGAQEHLLLVTIHHIVADEWSMGVFMRELARLYSAHVTGTPAALPELPIQYADHTLWQREWLQGAVLEAQLAYWRAQLAGAPDVLKLPTDRPRPPVQSFRGATYGFALPLVLSQALRQLSRQEGVTLFMTLLAAFQVLLARYTGQVDIVVGSPIAGRTRTELEGLIGFFVNTLVLRTDLAGDPTFRELLGRVREVTLGAYAHQELPFERVVEELQPVRDLSHNPLFQVMFVLQNGPTLTEEFAGLIAELDVEDTEAAKFDLTLFLEETEQGLAGVCEYSTDLFDAGTIARLIGHFQTLLEGSVADASQHIAELPLLSEAERRQLLAEWNDTAASYPHDQCIHELFEAQVERTPEAVAVVCADQQLTYRELNQRANQLAHYLQARGVGPEVLVGLCVQRSLEMVVGLLGIIKAGGAYVPLDPAYPAERLAFMLDDADVPILLTQRHLLNRLPDHEVEVLCLDADWPEIAQQDDANAASTVTPQNLAYVIYTSGSTGRPKGAMIVHRGLANYVSWAVQAYPVSEGQGAPVHSSISFDLTITGLFVPLLAGRATHLLPEQPGAETLTEALRISSDFSLVKITPTHLELLAQQLAPAQAAGRTRSFIIGGENLRAESVTFWRDYAPETVLVNEYGPTETVVGCCVYTVSADTPRTGSIPIGRPIANTQIYILDRHLQPVPIGVWGELYIGGIGVARGYLNRAELTAEKFIPNPFSDVPGARLYKTGDLARYLPDGNIEYLGRLDHQVKLRGFRIELGEIEAVLQQHPAVREAVVLAREDGATDKRLVACVVPQAGSPPTPAELHRYLRAQLPEYMVPAAFVTLDALPLTPNGKLDRRALPPPDQMRPPLDEAYVAPRTPVEAILARIWAQVLGVEKVGIHDNFFELGGDSILSIQIMARTAQAGLRLTPKQLFQCQTIAEQAMVAETTSALAAGQDLVVGPVPLTPIQHWFFEQEQPEPQQWNQAMLLHVRPGVDAALLERAVRHVLGTHDALRLRFVRTAAGWQQVHAAPDGAVPFSRVDLSALPEPEQGAAIEAAATELQASLNLAEGPIVQVALFDLGPHQPSRLLIIIHHLAVDGVSWRILLEDLQIIYEQLSQGQAPQLPPKTTSFKTWAERLTTHAQSTDLRQELAYWLAESRTRVSRLPVDYPSGEGANTAASARTVAVSLSVAETGQLLQEVPKAYHTQINDVLLTALVQAFAQWTGASALLVDLEGHGREALFDAVDLSRTVGWFTSIFPVLLDLGVDSAPGSALKRIKEQLRRIPQRGIGYGLLRYLSEDVAIVEKLRQLPRAEVSFNYLGQFDQVLSGASLFGPAQESSGPPCSQWAHRRYLLEINGEVLGGQLQLSWTYSEHVHERATIEGVAHAYMEALRLLIAHCQSPEAGGFTPSDFPGASLSQKDLDRLVARISRR